jgi:uncharacterized DUF497 family protein
VIAGGDCSREALSYDGVSLQGWTRVFDWDDGNIEHIGQHGIQPDEAEAAVLDRRRRVLPAQLVGAERRRLLIGRARGGRILFVVVTPRGGSTRVVTARDADEAEKRLYRRRK